MDNKKIVNFIFELAQLKRLERAGLKLAGIRDSDSVAEHSLRAAQIGYILAQLENYQDPKEICVMLVWHDIGECRIGDIHKVANRYVTAQEETAVKDQLQDLEKLGQQILNFWQQAENKKTPAGAIARDADLLEVAFTAKEFIEQGFAFAQDWITNVSDYLQTDSAKKLLAQMQASNSNDWWQGLKKLK